METFSISDSYIDPLVSSAIFMPLANATAILQSLPMAILQLYFLAMSKYKRWVAIIIGFAGVLLIIRPGSDGFNEFSFMLS